MTNFPSILSKGCEIFMAPELNFYFSCYFHYSFFSSLLYPSFPSDIIFEFNPSTSLKGLILVARTSMRRDIFPYIPTSWISPLLYLKVCYEQTCRSWLGLCEFLLIVILWSLQISKQSPRKLSLTPIWSIKYHGYSIGTVRHDRSNKILKYLLWRLISFRSHII